MATLLDLQADKEKLEGKLKDLTTDYKTKAATLKQKILVVDTEIFKKETGIYAEAARKVEKDHPEFSKIIKREVERLELEAKTPKAPRVAKAKA